MPRAISVVDLGAASGDPARRLRPIIDAWPASAGPPPELHAVSPPESAAPLDLSSVVVLLADEPGERLSRTIDRIDDLRRTIVVIAPPEALARAPRLGVGVAPLSSDLAPAAAALVLAALMTRQAASDLLLSEHDALRRSQSGLEREMAQIRDELQLAARVQREFMPKRLPECPGLEIAAIFRPCGYVSGDIYDVVRLDETRVGFFIADAVGHGVPAALMTMVLSHGMSMKEIRGSEYHVVAPGEVLRRCNDALIAGNLPSDRFLTAGYGVIDTATMHVRYAGAGHPPPMVVGAGEARAIETDGPLLGVFPGVEFEETEFTLEAGETLVLYSDGFETAFPDAPETEDGVGFSRRLPTTRYLDHFARIDEARREAGSLAQAFAQLATAVDAQSGSLHQVDDITALAIAPAHRAARRPRAAASAA